MAYVQQNKQEDQNQLGMVGQDNQGVIPSSQPSQQQSAETQKSSGQSGVLSGQKSSNQGRGATKSRSNFTDLGAYTKANQGAIQNQRQGLVDRYSQNIDKYRQDVRGGIDDIYSGENTAYNPAADRGTLSQEADRVKDEGYLYKQLNYQDPNVVTSGMSMLDRSLMKRAGTGHEIEKLIGDENKRADEDIRSYASNRYDDLYSSNIDDYKAQALEDLKADVKSCLFGHSALPCTSQQHLDKAS